MTYLFIPHRYVYGKLISRRQPEKTVEVGLLAIVGVLLTSYMGTQAQAIGYKRDYSGLLGRADRLVLLMIFPIVQHIALRFPVQLPWNITIIELVLGYFAVVGNITALQRFHLTLRWFRGDGSKGRK